MTPVTQFFVLLIGFLIVLFIICLISAIFRFSVNVLILSFIAWLSLYAFHII